MRKVVTGLLIAASAFSLNVASAQDGVNIDGKKYLYAYEMKCRVEKAVPAPEKGPTWYTSSNIGDVWMKFVPNQSSGPNRTYGTILLYRTDRVYKELAFYKNAWWTWSDEEEIQGTAKVGISDSLDGPFYFSISRFDEQGLFNGDNGKPKYFLSRCLILDALATYTPE